MKDSLSKSNLWGLFAVLAMLNVWDAATTAVLVAKFGADVEANPIMHHAISLYGISGLYMMKFLVVSFLGLVLATYLRYYQKHSTSKMIQRSLWVLNAMIALIVVNNMILVYHTFTI